MSTLSDSIKRLRAMMGAPLAGAAMAFIFTVPVGGIAGPAAAQDVVVEDAAAQADGAAADETAAAEAGTAADSKTRAGGDVFPSLFFTDQERQVIQTALEKGKILDIVDVRSLLNDGDENLDDIFADDTAVDEGPKVRTGPSEIELAGVLYFSTYDWTIWLNGERVTPYFIPEEVVKLDVSRNNVYIEWFDEFTDRIIRINLKPHQTFYMDANVILSNQPTP